MSNKRDYPLFLIDRSRASAYPFDYITCQDRQVGFVARVVIFTDDAQLNEFNRRQQQIENADISAIGYKLRKGGIVIVIEDFLYHFDLTNDVRSRIKTLLKKALKKYIHTEAERVGDGDLDIDNQIKQQQLSIELTRQNYENLLQRANGDKEIADYQIALAESILETLKKYRDNMKYFTINSN